MKKKKYIVIVVMVLMSLLIIACGKEEIGTNIEVNGTVISLGMSGEEIKEEMKDENLNYHSAIGYGAGNVFYPSGFACDGVQIRDEMNNNLETNMVLGYGANVQYNFNFKGGLQEIWICWSEDYNEEDILEQLKNLYGSTYTDDWIDFAGIEAVYRWDMEDGTSILYMPEKEPGNGAGMFMIYTEDIEDVEPLKTKVSNK